MPTIVEHDWTRLDKPPIEDEQLSMLAIVTWMDKSVCETILVHTRNVGTHAIYRKRNWYKSSVMGAGEVWFTYNA